MEYLIIILPIAIVILSAWFFFKALSTKEEVDWKRIIFGSLTIAVLYAWLLFAPSLGYLSGLFEFLFASGTSILAGIFLVGFLPSYRKLFSLILIIVSPIIMYLCIDIGLYYSPTSIIERNGEELAVALETYNFDNDSYPENLEDLVPNYIEDVKSPNTIWGWLYKLDGDEYILGYVYYVGKMGYSLQIYRPSNPEWEFIEPSLYANQTGPFILEPTPTDR